MPGATETQEKSHLRDNPQVYLEDGTPKYNRRLSDKILAAFNQAYKLGELELAQNLRWILARAELRVQKKFERRQANQASKAAADWIKSIDNDPNPTFQRTQTRRTKPTFK